MTEQTHKKLSRRDAMKILAAAAGATALANIPNKWSKPGLEVGVLPAHAQTSVISVLHTLLAGKPQDVGFCFATALISTVTISPADTGILMRYTISPDPSVTISAPPLLTDTVPTVAGGIASLTFTAADISGSGTVTILWAFENASDGTGSSSQLFTPTGC